MAEDTEHLHVVVSHLYFFFGEMSTQVLFVFFKLSCLLVVELCESSLYIMHTDCMTLIRYIVYKYFSHSLGCLFYFLDSPLIHKSFKV